MSSSLDEEELLLLYAVVESQQKGKRIWVHDINRKIENYGKYHHLCRYCVLDESCLTADMISEVNKIVSSNSKFGIEWIIVVKWIPGSKFANDEWNHHRYIALC
ncbi:Hypothetical protein CINCED_3A009597 [Cinara cedri]|uniref:Uncharacterized protein n=1 Tax=Cinara cedri TaxID=506608 RepID=A0A5E4NQS8_9HEMI|nr:Hypothetical protein CINCED_3A009597 [Cinara cedri]